MSTIDKKTLAGLLLGIGAFAVAASRSKRGSQSFFPPPTGKAPKGTDGFTEEQDEIFFSFKQNAPKKAMELMPGNPKFSGIVKKEREIEALEQQKASKQQSLRQLQKSLSQVKVGDATAIAQMQNQINSIEAQMQEPQQMIDKARSQITLMQSGYGDFDEAEERVLKDIIATSQAQIAAIQQKLTKVQRVVPQIQKMKMQNDALDLSNQVMQLQINIEDLNLAVEELDEQLAEQVATTGDDYTFAEYFTEFSERGYDADAAARYGAGSPGDKAWEAWEQKMKSYENWGKAAPKFKGTSSSDASALSGTGFKSGVQVGADAEQFSGKGGLKDPFVPTIAMPKFK